VGVSQTGPLRKQGHWKLVTRSSGLSYMRKLLRTEFQLRRRVLRRKHINPHHTVGCDISTRWLGCTQVDRDGPRCQAGDIKGVWDRVPVRSPRRTDKSPHSGVCCAQVRGYVNLRRFLG